MAVRAVPGTRIANPTTREILYSPPEGADLIREKLSAWERFVHAEDELDPLVRMAAAHYQFEAIHPFHDGNGRTGRVINILMLIEAGLLDAPILYLSRAIIARKNDYYRLLRAVTAEGAWIEWILYMLDVVRESASSTTRKIGSIRTCQEDIATRARAATLAAATHSSSPCCSSSHTAGSATWPIAAVCRASQPHPGCTPWS